mmetsp:Transcript_31213/g.76140  ORF Transcript_31213/g.76140 Transcript_31213/m.76140 type:complete len:193 (-) Transcript_31213:155-733(-)
MPENFLPVDLQKEWSYIEDSEFDDDSSDMENDVIIMEEDDSELSDAESEEEKEEAKIPVWKLKCQHCSHVVNKRGMLVHLVADETTTLYSSGEGGDIDAKGDEEKFATCDCKTQKTWCKNCSKEVGYRVTQPCNFCMSAQNNGHYWMYTKVNPSVQYIGTELLTWSSEALVGSDSADDESNEGEAGSGSSSL